MVNVFSFTSIDWWAEESKSLGHSCGIHRTSEQRLETVGVLKGRPVANASLWRPHLICLPTADTKRALSWPGDFNASRGSRRQRTRQRICCSGWGSSSSPVGWRRSNVWERRCYFDVDPSCGVDIPLLIPTVQIDWRSHSWTPPMDVGAKIPWTCLVGFDGVDLIRFHGEV